MGDRAENMDLNRDLVRLSTSENVTDGDGVCLFQISRRKVERV